MFPHVGQWLRHCNYHPMDRVCCPNQLLWKYNRRLWTSDFERATDKWERGVHWWWTAGLFSWTFHRGAEDILIKSILLLIAVIEFFLKAYLHFRSWDAVWQIFCCADNQRKRHPDHGLWTGYLWQLGVNVVKQDLQLCCKPGKLQCRYPTARNSSDVIF